MIVKIVGAVFLLALFFACAAISYADKTAEESDRYSDVTDVTIEGGEAETAGETGVLDEAEAAAVGETDEIIDEDEIGDDVRYTLYDSGTMIISGNGEIEPREFISYSYRYASNITSLIIEDGITKIGKEAFSSCRNIRTVEIADSVASIGEEAFRGCTGLELLKLPAGLKSVGKSCFALCESLREVEIPDKVMTLGESTFDSCPSLEKVKLPSGITEIESNMFIRCTKLSEVVIPGNVIRIGTDAFKYCYSLDSIDLPDSVEYIEGGAFKYCESLKEIIIPEKVEEIPDDAFSGCEQLETVSIPSGVTSIGKDAFSSTNIRSIELPDSLTRMDLFAVDYCERLEEIHIDSYDHWLNLSFGEGSPLQWTNAKLITDDNTDKIEISSQITTIPYGTFRDNTSLESIELPKAIKKIGGNAFSGCENLKEVNVSSIDRWCNIKFGSAASNPLNASPDAILRIGGGTGSKAVISEGAVEIPDRTFSGWEDMSSVTIPSTIERIGAGAFQGCTALNTVNVSDLTSWLNVELATESSSPLSGGGAKLKVQNGNSYDSLQDVTIGKNVGSLPAYAFSGSDSLRTVVIPDNVTRIGVGAFASCTGLAAVTIPETVTALEEKTFSGCTSLKKILIPETVTRIEYSAFSDCSKNLVIYGYEGSEAESYADSRGISFLPYTEYDSIQTGNLWEDIRWTLFDGISLTIEGEGKIPDYDSGQSPLHAVAGKVTSVKLKGITGIGSNTFEDFGRLKSVSVNLDTEISSIGAGAFSGCEDVEISCYSNSYSKVNSIISGNAGFDGIKVRLLSGSRMGNVTWTYNENTRTIIFTSNGSSEFGESFSSSPFDGLDARTIEFSDAFACENIPDNLFKGCSSISRVQLPEKVKKIGKEAFKDCINLQSVIWSEDISTLGEGAFEGCKNLSDIHIIGNATFNEAELEISEASAEIPEGVTDIPDRCFESCTSLKQVDWYEDPEEGAVTGTIGAEAFDGCIELDDISIPNYVEKIGDKAFYDCVNLSGQDFGENLKSLGTQAFYGCELIRTFGFEENLSSIGEMAIGYYTGKDGDSVASRALTVEAPESAETIKSYCKNNGFEFRTTEGLGGSQADGKVYVNMAGSVTVKKNHSSAVKFKTNGKVKKVTRSGGEGKVSVTRSGSKVKFRGLSTGVAKVNLTFRMTGSKSLNKTVYVTVKKGSASISDGEEQVLQADKKSLTFAGESEKAQKIKVSGVMTRLACTQSKEGIVKVSVGNDDTVTVTPAKAGQVDIRLFAEGDEVFKDSNVVSISVTVQTKQTETKQTAAKKVMPKTVTAKVKKLSKTKAKVSWKKVTGATGYQVQVSVKKNFKGKKTYNIKKGTLKKNVTIKKGKKNYIRVRYKYNGKYYKWSKTFVVKK
ncbi:MAG: leucine-rich repeat domain-containing protein [Firmicutes bacterium]|nr:leucine-rich repeat domain-containing protein [Bacillota bacterium]